MAGKAETTINTGRRNERGFSLIEMMIAATVITVGLVAVAGVSAYISRTNSTSNIMSILATVAQDQADTMRNLTWDQLTEAAQLRTTGGSTVYASADNNHRTQLTGTPAGDLNISWQVTDGPGTTSDLRTVTIRVVQVNAPPQFSAGYTLTLLISKV
ncbi:MAG: prepilin-type N-terminal cleavage/methylation domain-containing protein [Blastocatellia bacterium]